MKFARIAVLGIALGAGGIAAYLAANVQSRPKVVKPHPTAKIDTIDVLVAKRNLEFGHALHGGDVGWEKWPAKFASSQFIRRREHPAAPRQLIGYIARGAFVSGEPIREAKLIKADGSGYMAAVLSPGMRAVSTELTPASGAGGFILPNDHVDVILTSAQKDAVGHQYYKSRTILTNVRVLAIDQTINDKSGKKTVIGKIATLELSPKNAEKLSLARRLGSISLTLRGFADSGTGNRSHGVSLAREENVTIVRFGQASTR